MDKDEAKVRDLIYDVTKVQIGDCTDQMCIRDRTWQILSEGQRTFASERGQKKWFFGVFSRIIFIDVHIDSRFDFIAS